MVPTISRVLDMAQAEFARASSGMEPARAAQLLDSLRAERGVDGRGQVTGGVASGARQTLKRPGSDRLSVCGSDAKWSLLIRHLDPD